jgi:hypothetical protein
MRILNVIFFGSLCTLKILCLVFGTWKLICIWLFKSKHKAFYGQVAVDCNSQDFFREFELSYSQK